MKVRVAILLLSSENKEDKSLKMDTKTLKMKNLDSQEIFGNGFHGRTYV